MYTCDIADIFKVLVNLLKFVCGSFFTTLVHNLRLSRQVVCIHDHIEHKSENCYQIIFCEELIDFL